MEPPPPSSKTNVRTVPCHSGFRLHRFCPLLPASGPLARHLPKTLRTSVALLKRIQPFLGWSDPLLWPRLTSPRLSGNVSVTVVSFVPQSGRHTWKHSRAMRATFTLMPAAFTSMPPVQVSDFEDIGLLIRHDRLVCDFYSSGQRFACGFLQIPPRDGHPCRPADTSPCRACRELTPPSDRLHTICNQLALEHHAPCRAHTKNNRSNKPLLLNAMQRFIRNYAVRLKKPPSYRLPFLPHPEYPLCRVFQQAQCLHPCCRT